MIKVDTHVHCISSKHAYSTIEEIHTRGLAKGLEAIAITDHFGPRYTSENLFSDFASITNIRNIAKFYTDLKIISGAEIDIVDKEGNLAFFDSFFDFDSKQSILDRLFSKIDLVIASYHQFDSKNYSYEDLTEMLLNVLKNKNVHILGHIDRIEANYDIEEVIYKASLYKKAIEINEYSFFSKNFSIDKMKKIINLCKKYKAYISIGTDAHIAKQVGDFSNATKLLKELEFPYELIINRNLCSLNNFLSQE
ncbi:putative phosphatase YcdX [Streptococcus infantarius subsp. infantarius]|nr:putative phosphatase YcdX [Streptococcus infantarius subsp. infantarius]MCO4493186.1 putative phosphatase YcdX [Streptococcus infantarius subsp. infantarius]MCO4518500.1 putative phosphatase YcdX [Streptococcus infantarius subsp. infantarius]MCO4524547.1 putative phosphatase YcdX [Streptococcus infantarius subsp. infantarius]